MTAPTALVRAPDPDSAAGEPQMPTDQREDELLLDAGAGHDVLMEDAGLDVAQREDVAIIDEEGRPKFAPIKNIETLPHRESRTVPIPPHRMTPLKQCWPQLYTLLVNLKLQVRVRIRTKSVELRTCKATKDSGALQKGADFIKAFALGFRVEDAVALLRLDNLWIETFEIRDIKTLNPEATGRAIGRIAGKDGKTKFAIENTSRTRIVLADTKIHILGEFQAIHIARESIVSLVLGKTPSKVYGGLRTVAARMKERF